MKSIILLTCLNFLSCVETQIHEYNLKPVDFFVVKTDMFDSIYVSQVDLKNYEFIEIRYGEIRLRHETLKSGLENSLLLSKIAKKIEKGIYSIKIEILNIYLAGYGRGESNCSSVIKYTLYKKNILVKDFILESRIESLTYRRHPKVFLENSIQQNFQKFIFELSKEKL